MNFVDAWGLSASDVKYNPDSWIDNGNGTYTAQAGATLWGLYGSDWESKSGYTGDPTKLQVGETVGKKNEISESLLINNTIESQEITTPEKGPNYLMQGLLGAGEILGGLATYVGITAWGTAQEAATIQMQGTLDPSVGYSMLAGYSYASLMFADGINLLSNAFAKKETQSVFIPIFKSLVTDPMLDVGEGLNDYKKKEGN